VPRFKKVSPKFKQGAAPCFSNVGRTLISVEKPVVKKIFSHECV
jgi:hypothetical protein